MIKKRLIRLFVTIAIILLFLVLPLALLNTPEDFIMDLGVVSVVLILAILINIYLFPMKK